jgi:ABC-2 type transport system permease protein
MPSRRPESPLDRVQEDDVKLLSPKVLAIVRREYLQRVRSRWFLIATFGVPILLVGFGALSGIFIAGGERQTTDLTTGVVDRTVVLGDLVVEELLRDSLLATNRVAQAALSDDSLRADLLGSDHDLYLVLPEELAPGRRATRTEEGAPAGEAAAEQEADELEDVDLELLARENVNIGTRRNIRQAVNRALVRARLLEAGVEGIDPGELLAGASVEVINVTQEGSARSQEVFEAISFIVAFIFYMVLIFYGQMIVRSVVEEKTTDIVEIMVSSVRPWELMLGKIVGVGAVGLTQITIWAAVVGIGILYGLTAGAAALGEAGVDLSEIAVPLGTVIGVLAFLILGYLLYSGLFAAAGATISNEQDTQHVMWPVLILIILPFLAAQGIIGNPNTPMAIALSLVPFFSPLLMSSRMMVSTIPLWQWASALVLLIACIGGAAWVAGRIYRVGILMKGKRPNLPEVVRWVRHG